MPNSSGTNSVPMTSTLPRQNAEERAAASRKRKYDSFVAESTGEMASDDRPFKVLKPFIQAGLWWPRGICLYSDISATLCDGIENEMEKAGEEEEDGLNDQRTLKSSKEALKLRERNIRAFSLFAEKYPELVEVFHQTIEYEDQGTFNRLAKAICKGYKQARRTDTSLEKDDICDWLIPAMEESTDELDDFSFAAPALTRNELKSARGINHPLTRAFLIPFGFIDRVYYQEDGAEACKKVFDDLKKGAKNAKKNRGKGKKGRNAIVQDDSRGIPLESDSLCAFMYFINSYDSGKVWSGLLRGPLLVIAYRAIFTGPSSALGEKGAPTKSGNAKIHGVSEVSFESIAYVAAQVRFALCSKNSWVKEDGVFNLECFYFYLLDLMLKAPTKWGDELLEFWNDAVFGDASTVPDSLGEPRPDSDMARALKQFTRDFMNDDEGVDGGDEDVDGGGESS